MVLLLVSESSSLVRLVAMLVAVFVTVFVPVLAVPVLASVVVTMFSATFIQDEFGNADGVVEPGEDQQLLQHSLIGRVKTTHWNGSRASTSRP